MPSQPLALPSWERNITCGYVDLVLKLRCVRGGASTRQPLALHGVAVESSVTTHLTQLQSEEAQERGAYLPLDSGPVLGKTLEEHGPDLLAPLLHARVPPGHLGHVLVKRLHKSTLVQA